MKPIAEALRSRRAVVAAGFAALVSVAAVLWWPGGGPLELPDPHGWVVPEAVVGEAFTDGLEVLRIPDGGTITIESIDIVGDVNGLEVVGAYLAGDDREIGAIAWDPEFPPADPALGDLIPAVGTPIGPLEDFHGWELLLGLQVTEPGFWHREAIEIRYRSGLRRFTARLPAELYVCTEGYEGECDRAFELAAVGPPAAWT